MSNMKTEDVLNSFDKRIEKLESTGIEQDAPITQVYKLYSDIKIKVKFKFNKNTPPIIGTTVIGNATSIYGIRSVI